MHVISNCLSIFSRSQTSIHGRRIELGLGAINFNLKEVLANASEDSRCYTSALDPALVADMKIFRPPYHKGPIQTTSVEINNNLHNISS